MEMAAESVAVRAVVVPEGAERAAAKVGMVHLVVRVVVKAAVGMVGVGGGGDGGGGDGGGGQGGG